MLLTTPTVCFDSPVHCTMSWETSSAPPCTPPVTSSPATKKGKWGLKMRTEEWRLKPEQLPKLPPTTTVLAQLCHSSRWSAPLPLCSHSSPLHQPCILTLILVLAQVPAWPLSKPVQSTVLADDFISPRRQWFLLTQTPWIGSLGAKAVLQSRCVSAPLGAQLQLDKLSRSPSTAGQPIAETRGKSELLQPYFIAKCSSSMHRLHDFWLPCCALKYHFSGNSANSKNPTHLRFTFRTRQQLVFLKE